MMMMILTLSSVTWSSCDSMAKPGMRFANSTTPRIAGEKRSLKSSRIRFVPSTCWGMGFRGQACGERREQAEQSSALNMSIVKVSLVH